MLYALTHGAAPAASAGRREEVHNAVRLKFRQDFYSVRKCRVNGMTTWRKYQTQKVLFEPNDSSEWPAEVRWRFRVLRSYASICTKKRVAEDDVPEDARDVIAKAGFPTEVKETLHWTDLYYIAKGVPHPVAVEAWERAEAAEAAGDAESSDSSSDSASDDTASEASDSSTSSVSRASTGSLASVKSRRNKAEEARKAKRDKVGKRK